MSVEISVIITNYNNDVYLGRAIRSCLNQTLPIHKYEIIVVDDGSDDNSVDVIDSFGASVRSLPLSENVGVAEASNIGIKTARGRFVVRVDSDDYVNENFLLFMYEILNQNLDLGFVYSDHLRVDENETVLERVDINTLDLLYRHGAGIMFRKTYLEAIGLYNKRLRNAEDYDLLRRYLKEFSGYHLVLPLYRYRIHATNMTKDDEERKRWEQIANENENRE